MQQEEEMQLVEEMQQYDEGDVMHVVSEYTVEVDGIPRHVKDLRRRRVCDEDQ